MFCTLFQNYQHHFEKWYVHLVVNCCYCGGVCSARGCVLIGCGCGVCVCLDGECVGCDGGVCACMCCQAPTSNNVNLHQCWRSASRMRHENSMSVFYLACVWNYQNLPYYMCVFVLKTYFHAPLFQIYVFMVVRRLVSVLRNTSDLKHDLFNILEHLIFK